MPVGMKSNTKMSRAKAITSFVLGAEIARGERFHHAEQQAAQYGTGNAADAAQYRGGEGLQARHEAEIGLMTP